eukprot:Hpha_TRINITY_DN10052_c0_g3::TRINITY_DN10052_c0_g3_i1::g.83848::m.83848
MNDDVEEWVVSVGSNRGVVDMVSGDRRSASFNARFQCVGHGCAAINVAFKRSSGDIERVSNGIVSGRGFSGDFGSSSLMRFMVIGPVACFVPHLERVARKWGCRRLINDALYGEAEHAWDALLQ